MLMHSVVVGFDGSDGSFAAAAAAYRILDASGTLWAIDIKTVKTFYRDEARADLGGALPHDPDFFEKQWDSAAHAAFTQLVQMPHAPGIAVRHHVLTLMPGQHGSIAAMLEAWACEHHAEAICVGRHQGSPVKENFLGSVPHWLTTHSTLPVLIAPSPTAR